MAPPQNLDGQDENDNGSLTVSEREQFQQKIKALEDKYTDLDGNYKTLNKKYEDEVAKKACASCTCNTEPIAEIAAKRDEISNALKEFKTLTAEINSCSVVNNKQRIEFLDQYGRRNILLFHKLLYPNGKYGIAFIKWIVEEINKMFPDLEVPVELSHIDDAHPLKTKTGEHSVVIVKLNCRWLKNEIYNKRAQLKNTSYKNISISEQLTSHTQNLMDTTRTVLGNTNTKVYTNNCTISCKFNNRKYVIRSYKDVQYLAKKVGYRQPLPPPGIPAPSQSSSNVFDPGMQTFEPYYQSSLHPQGRLPGVGRGHVPGWDFNYS